jgi:cell wall-associated NlpC family hydrolase
LSLINQDPGARTRKNPLASAKEFVSSDPFVNRPDSMSGQFQAVFEDIGPISVAERAASQVAGSQPSWIERQNVELQQEADKAVAARIRNNAMQAQSTGGFTGTNASAAGRAYQPDGSLSGSRQQLLRQTAGYSGTPYQLGGRTAKGIDCSGLVMSVYNSLGFDIKSHSVSGQARSIPGVKTSVNNLRPGDLVVWGDNSHIAIYAGNGQIWDASRSKGTTLRPLWGRPDQVYGIAVKLPGE